MMLPVHRSDLFAGCVEPKAQQFFQDICSCCFLHPKVAETRRRSVKDYPRINNCPHPSGLLQTFQRERHHGTGYAIELLCSVNAWCWPILNSDLPAEPGQRPAKDPIEPQTESADCRRSLFQEHPKSKHNLSFTGVWSEATDSRVAAAAHAPQSAAPGALTR